MEGALLLTAARPCCALCPPSAPYGRASPPAKERLRSSLGGRTLGGAHSWQIHERRVQAFAAKASLDAFSLVETAKEAVAFGQNAVYSIADAANDVAIQAVTSSAADAASSAVDAASTAAETASTFVKQQDWLTGLADVLESILKLLENGLANVHVPYAYGFSIILLTLLVKAATYPLTKQQVESTMAMQNLQPKIKAIQTKYQGDQERIQLETARLYQQAGVNPLAGCLPTLATIPVWIGLYRALSNVANEGVLTEGFFWIPSLAGPSNGQTGLTWLFPFVDGAPPLGWLPTAAYLVLPVMLVASQFFSMQLMQPATTDPAQKQTQAILKFLPFMIGYFSLSVPSGLSLYWLTNNVLSTAQQLYLKQYGGATPVVGKDGSGIIDAGQAKRSGAATIATVEEKEVERTRGERWEIEIYLSCKSSFSCFRGIDVFLVFHAPSNVAKRRV